MKLNWRFGPRLASRSFFWQRIGKKRGREVKRNPADLLKITGFSTSVMNINGNDLTGSKNIQGSNGSGQYSIAGSSKSDSPLARGIGELTFSARSK